MNFEPKEHVIICTPTGEEGMQSCRPRFRVFCKTCGEELHPGTTAPGSRIQDHIYDGQWWHERQKEYVCDGKSWHKRGEEGR